jgi:amino acid transporter
MHDFMAVAGGSYGNNFAEILLQIVGKNGTMTLCILCWLDGTCCTTICILSAQRVTYAIARDGMLLGSKYLQKLSKGQKMPVSAALLVLVFAIVICV